MRTPMSLALVAIVLFSSIAAPVKAHAAEPPLAGLRAVYVVSTTYVHANGLVERASERVESTVLGQQGGVLTIATVTTRTGSPARRAEYMVPVAAVVRPTPGTVTSTAGGLTFSDVQSVHTAAGAIQVLTEGATDGIWYRRIAVQLRGALPLQSLVVDLVETTNGELTSGSLTFGQLCGCYPRCSRLRSQ